MAHNDEDASVLTKLDAAAAPLAKFDAFPKVPSAYKARSEGRGFITVFVMLLTFVLMLNDIGEYIWGWPEFRFAVDKDSSQFLFINLDMVVNMQCAHLSVDLRDAVGDRLLLSGGLRRDGTKFDVGQATVLKAHSEALSATRAVAQSRRSRGLFDTLLRRDEPKFKPTYNHEADGSACRIFGTLGVKRATANLHITTLGHGYASYEHVDHTLMNLSHVITEFSFGPHFPDITQPLDNSFEVTQDHFTAYQYFLHVVPTTYIAPRTRPLQTNQYSVTHYTRVLSHHQGTPGIFFKFDLDPLNITIHQKTTTFVQLMIRCVGVIGGVFVCMGYAIRITVRAVEVVSGADSTPGIVAAEASGVKVGLRAKWGGGELRARPKSGRLIPQGNGWVMEGASGPGASPYASYAGTPVSASFAPPQSPFAHSAGFPNGAGSAPPQSATGLGFPSGTFGPVGSPSGPGGNGHGHGHVRTPSLLGGPPRTPRSPYMGGATLPSGGAVDGSSYPPSSSDAVAPGATSYALFPPTPNPANGGGNGFAHQQQRTTPPPPPGPGVPKGGKKDD